jgi:hypothetical protein
MIDNYARMIALVAFAGMLSIRIREDGVEPWFVLIFGIVALITIGQSLYYLYRWIRYD